MCEFCSMKELDNCKKLGAKNISIGLLTVGMQNQLWYERDDDGGNPRLTVILTDAFGNGAGEFSYNIEYCPVCGKKL